MAVKVSETELPQVSEDSFKCELREVIVEEHSDSEDSSEAEYVILFYIDAIK